MTISPEITALVVAIAGIILPAIANRERREREGEGERKKRERERERERGKI